MISAISAGMSSGIVSRQPPATCSSEHKYQSMLAALIKTQQHSLLFKVWCPNMISTSEEGHEYTSHAHVACTPWLWRLWPVQCFEGRLYFDRILTQDASVRRMPK